MNVTSSDTDPQAPALSISASAARRIQAVAAREPAAAVLRVVVRGGGCSGFSYELGFVAQPEPDDMVFEREGARVALDSAAIDLVRGSEVDFVDELIGAQFRIRNPNARSSCGCGVSFSI
jgi:iron-sulfur cluster assembly accessory protein